jgi:hypothetical protein
MEARRHGDPRQPEYRVSAFTHIDRIYPTRLVERAAVPWHFKCSTDEIYYDFREDRPSPLDYHPAAGLLIARTTGSSSSFIKMLGLIAMPQRATKAPA